MAGRLVKLVLTRSVAGAKPGQAAASSHRSSGRSHGVHQLSTCEQLVVELVRHPDSWPFMKLVSRTQVTHTPVPRVHTHFQVAQRCVSAGPRLLRHH